MKANLTWNVSTVLAISFASRPGNTACKRDIAWLRYGFPESSSIVCNFRRFRLPRFESSRTSDTHTATNAFRDWISRCGSTNVSNAGYTLKQINSICTRYYISSLRKEWWTIKEPWEISRFDGNRTQSVSIRISGLAPPLSIWLRFYFDSPECLETNLSPLPLLAPWSLHYIAWGRNNMIKYQCKNGEWCLNRPVQQSKMFICQVHRFGVGTIFPLKLVVPYIPF